MFVRTAKATGFVLHRSSASVAERVWSRGFIDGKAVEVVGSRSLSAVSPSKLSDDCWL